MLEEEELELIETKNFRKSKFKNISNLLNIETRSLNDNISEISTRFEQISPRRVAYDNFTTIDWNYDFAKDRIRKRTLKRRIGIKARLAEYYDHFQGWILVLLVGIITGFVAGFIGITAEWLSDVKDGFCLDYFYLSKGFCCLDTEFNQECAGWKNWFEVDSVNNIYGSVLNFLGGYFVFIWFSILFSCLSALLVKFYAPYAAGSGIPEVKTILGGFIIRRFLGFWTLLIKTVGLCLSVASGMSLGKEGPLVHVACCVGNIIPKFFKKYANNEAKRREILSCASAAGVSVAFG
ncbi:H(+)/Cl(-) exchange transporter 3, partial [Lobulomyces angularis]